MTQLSYFQVTGVWEPSSPKGVINGNVTFTMLIENNGVLAAPTLDNPAVVVPTVIHSIIDNNTLQPVSLLANTAPLNLVGTLYYTATFSDVSYSEPGKPEAGLSVGPITFAASTDTTPINLVNVTPAAGVVAAQLASITTSGITDATTLGRELLTVPDAATARADLSAATYLGSAASQSTMLSLTGNIGDYCYRPDLTAFYYLLAEPASVLSNWARNGRPPWPFPMARNTIAAIGDSITANGQYDAYLPAQGMSYLQQLQIMTHQRIRFGANFAISGTTIDNALTVQLPNVLAMNPLPGACVIASATNDLWVVTSPNPNFNTMVSKLKSIVAALLNAGIVPILWTVPPNTNTTSTIAVAVYQANIHQWNTWVRRYASLNGFPLIDSHAAMAAIDGTYISGYGASDLIHPVGAGERVIAQQALADGLADIFPPNSLVHTARQTNDLSNMFNNGTINYGLFTTDSNSDGVANGLTSSGTATFSLVAPVATDNLYGNWQQMVVTAGNSGVLQASITSGWSTGDVIAFSARVQTQGVESSTGSFVVSVVTDTPGGYVAPNGTTVTTLYNGLESFTADVTDGEVYVEFPVLSQMTTMKLYIWINSVPSGSMTVRVGEATIRNLTTGGLLA